MTKRIVTQAALRELFDYSPETGVFIRKTLSGGQLPGAIAGSRTHHKKYVFIRVFRIKYAAHRLAWLYVNGTWPIDQIDHINGIRDDNRLANLREANGNINAQNLRKPNRLNTTGFMGVTKRIKEDRFRAQISLNKKKFTIGDYKTAEEAFSAYLAVKRMIHPGCTI